MVCEQAVRFINQQIKQKLVVNFSFCKFDPHCTAASHDFIHFWLAHWYRQSKIPTVVSFSPSKLESPISIPVTCFLEAPLLFLTCVDGGRIQLQVCCLQWWHISSGVCFLEGGKERGGGLKFRIQKINLQFSKSDGKRIYSHAVSIFEKKRIIFEL